MAKGISASWACLQIAEAESTLTAKDGNCFCEQPNPMAHSAKVFDVNSDFFF
jgi:hypothetical protein